VSDLKPIAAELGVSERTLRRAISQGTLRASRPSPRKLWLPLSERRYLRRSWPLLSTLRSALRTEPNVRFALLFGSAAVGTDTAASDVDVLVALDNPDLAAVVDVEARLAGAVGRRVDVIRLEDAETSPNVLARAIRDGRVLIDREGVWPTLRAREPALARSGRRRQSVAVEAALSGIDELTRDCVEAALSGIDELTRD
jgi:predicted nucleotidyltransferase